MGSNQSLVLLDGEEILTLKGTILRKVSAVDSVFNAINTETSAEGVWPQILGDIWVHGATQVPECLDSVLLTNFKGNARPSGHLLRDLGEFGQDSLVNLEELFGCRSIQVEHLHS